MVGHCMELNVAARLTSVVFEQPAGRVESVADRDIDIFMRMVRGGIAPNDNFFPGNFEIDTDAEQLALPAARVPTLDDDTAGGDPITETFEFRGALTYSRRNRLRCVHVAKRDLKW